MRELLVTTLPRRQLATLTYICFDHTYVCMRTSVHIPDDLLKRAKRKAAEEGRTLTSLIEEGLRTVLAEKATERRHDLVLPRVSKATGGLQPGVDLVKAGAETQLQDDNEMMERVARQWAKRP